MKTPKTMNEFLNATHKCAMQMMENAAYIEAQLPSVELPDGIGVRIQSLCALLTGTKHDVMKELFELKEKAGATPVPSDLEPRVERIMRWLAEPVGEMNEVVTQLQAASEANPAYSTGFILLAESAVNILNALNDAEQAMSLLSFGCSLAPTTPPPCSAGI